MTTRLSRARAVTGVLTDDLVFGVAFAYTGSFGQLSRQALRPQPLRAGLNARSLANSRQNSYETGHTCAAAKGGLADGTAAGLATRQKQEQKPSCSY
jgi:hypothetical protein